MHPFWVYTRWAPICKSKFLWNSNRRFKKHRDTSCVRKCGGDVFSNGSFVWWLIILPNKHIISYVYMCQTCKEDFYTVETFKEHKCYILKKVEPEWELAWLVPIASLLHFKMAPARNVFPWTKKFPYQFLPTSWVFKYLVCSEYTILTHLVLWMGLPMFYMLEVASLCILNYFLSFNFFL